MAYTDRQFNGHTCIAHTHTHTHTHKQTNKQTINNVRHAPRKSRNHTKQHQQQLNVVDTLSLTTGLARENTDKSVNTVAVISFSVVRRL